MGSSSEYISATGERVLEDGQVVHVGLSPDMQTGLGTLLHFEPIAVGARVRCGDHIGVAEGTLTAAEIYAPCDGVILSVVGQDAKIYDWLIVIHRNR